MKGNVLPAACRMTAVLSLSQAGFLYFVVYRYQLQIAINHRRNFSLNTMLKTVKQQK